MPVVLSKRFRTLVVSVATALAVSAHAEPAVPSVYAEANAALSPARAGEARVVLMGDSITYHWKPDLLPRPTGIAWVNRGVPGQSSEQMRLRFKEDVVALAPAVVVILAGTNDLRVRTGSHADAEPAILERLSRNITTMADMASAHDIRVVLSAIPPFDAARDGYRRDPETKRKANTWLRAFAKTRGYPFVDYENLADVDGKLREGLSEDGLHPNAAAYALMQHALAEAVAMSVRR